MNERFREELASGGFMVGTWVTTSDPAMAEAAAGGDLDFVIVDTEHSPYSPETLQAVIMAMTALPCAVLVRVGSIEPVTLMQPLDMGADGIVIPRVTSAEDVAHIVTWTRYPPHGLRGYGPRRAGRYTRNEQEYVRAAERRITIVPMIETAGAAESLEQIAAVEGIDGLLVGRNDLAAALGVAGQPTHPDVLAVVDRTVEVCQRQGLAAGIAAAGTPEDVAHWKSAGMRLVAAGLDYEFVRQGVDGLKASTLE